MFGDKSEPLPETFMAGPPDMSIGPGQERSDDDSPAAPRIPGYRFVRFIAHGGMGAVWHAENLKTNQDVAIKVIGPLWCKPRTVRSVFEKEIKLAARLNHPNIARVYGGDPNFDPPYYVMQLVDGIALDAYLRDRTLSSREVLELVRTVCQAMQHAHQRLVVHRDLKFSNILVTADGKPHVIDFGLAKSMAEEDPYTTIVQPGYALGTLMFMSPEQAGGCANQIDTRTDVYSLGVMLYRLLTGRFPYDTEGNSGEVTRRIIEDEPRPAKGVDKELATLLGKAVAKRPEERYQSTFELAQDISNYLAGTPLVARAHTWVYRTRKYVSRHRRRVAVVAMAGALVIALLSTVYYRERRLRVYAETAWRMVAKQRVDALRQRNDALDDKAIIEEQMGELMRMRQLTVDKINQFNSRIAIALTDKAEAEALLEDMREWATSSGLVLPEEFLAAMSR